MIQHVVLISFTDDATDSQRDALVAGLRALPAQIPEIRAYAVGLDAGLAEGNAGIGIVAEFDDAAGWEAYRDHPAHRAVIDDLIAPIRAGRAAVQFER